jgi:hypothetical protein
MRQVRLVDDQLGSTLVSWIDANHAVVDKFVTLKLDDDTETPFMRIDEVYEPKMPAEVVNERSQDYKRTRKASDI